MLKKIYLSLGSNLGNREGRLQQAIDLLHSPGFKILRCSSVYETAPQEIANQPWFLNLILECETEVFPMNLMKRLLNIEKQMGRKRRVAKGPRLIDIDIIFFGRFAIDTPMLVVPHPRMHERRFVLEPMTELAPDLRHPISRRSVREMLSAITGNQAVKKTNWRPKISPLQDQNINR